MIYTNPLYPYKHKVQFTNPFQSETERVNIDSNNNYVEVFSIYLGKTKPPITRRLCLVTDGGCTYYVTLRRKRKSNRRIQFTTKILIASNLVQFCKICRGNFYTIIILHIPNLSRGTSIIHSLQTMSTKNIEILQVWSYNMIKKRKSHLLYRGFQQVSTTKQKGADYVT